MRMVNFAAAIVAMMVATSVGAATISGAVTNKTTSHASAGDKVALVDVSAGMADAATTITNSSGQFTLQSPGSGTYLIRVDHQGASYFIAAPQNGSAADITVYDVAAKVDNIGIDADMLLIEAGQGTLHVRERYLIRNASSPPRTQFSENTFEIVLPEGAQLEEAAATRPGGMGTRTHLIPLAQKGHYSFNVPIQPDQGEKETMFELAYHFSYSGKHIFNVHPIAPVDHLVLYTAKGIEFSAKDASRFKAAREDTRVDTHVAMNAHSGEEIVFTVSGEGQMPPDAGTVDMSSAAGSRAISGAGIGAAIERPNPLTGTKGWLFVGCTVILIGTVFMVLYWKKQALMSRSEPIHDAQVLPSVLEHAHTPLWRPSTHPVSQESGVLLESVKEELFALERDMVSGRVSLEEYTHAKVGLEAVLKRVLNTRLR